ncbi:MAG: hypothetical protein WC352_00840 [Candidatus Omnitrophota bacterium]
MSFLFKRIHHLIRYFIILGVVSFAGYVMRWQDQVFVVLVGPSIYLAHMLKGFVLSYLTTLPKTDTTDLYGFLMPVTLAYYGLTGFLMKQLWNERGFIRSFSLVIFVAFLLYIHWKTSVNLAAYFAPNA